MTLLLHAIVPTDDVCEVDVPLVAVDAGRLRGCASEDEVDLHEHHRRIMLLHERCSACLPARFGSRFADAEALRAVLVREQERLWASLERVRGRSELAVTAVWTQAPHVAEGGPGTRYLRQRLERERIARQVAEVVQREAGAAATARTLKTREGVALSMALLVPNECAAHVAERVCSVDAHGSVRILVSGPWAPYSFVGKDQREE